MDRKNDPIDLVKTQNRDAMEWAKAFKETVLLNNIAPDDLIDEGFMVGWFANAMMSMHDSIHNNEIKEIEAKNSKLKELLLLTDPVVSSTIVGDTQITQWSEFIKCFPEEG